MYQGHQCMGMCAQAHVFVYKKEGKTRDRAPRYHRSIHNIGPSVAQYRCGIPVAVHSRDWCASSEGGCGCHRASVLRTAPVKTNRHEAGG
jgi:hypothetical protein